jgi:hypothetical protein
VKAATAQALIAQIESEEEERARRAELRRSLAEVLLEGDNQRLALLRACERYSGYVSWDVPDDPAPAEGTALARWVMDCETSVKDLMDAPAVVEMRMHSTRHATPVEIGRGNADAYSRAFSYIDWLRAMLVKLDEPLNVDFRGEL